MTPVAALWTSDVERPERARPARATLRDETLPRTSTGSAPARADLRRPPPRPPCRCGGSRSRRARRRARRSGARSPPDPARAAGDEDGLALEAHRRALRQRIADAGAALGISSQPMPRARLAARPPSRLRGRVPEPVEQLHLLLAVAAHVVVRRQLLRSARGRAHAAGTRSAASRGRRGRRCRRGLARPRAKPTASSVRADARRIHLVDADAAATVVLWALNITVTKYILDARPAAARLLGSALLGRRQRSSSGSRSRSSARLRSRGRGTARRRRSRSPSCSEPARASSTRSAHDGDDGRRSILGTMPVFTGCSRSRSGVEQIDPALLARAAVVSFGGVALVALGASGDFSADLAGTCSRCRHRSPGRPTRSPSRRSCARTRRSGSARSCSRVSWVPLAIVGEPAARGPGLRLSARRSGSLLRVRGRSGRSC